MLIFSTFGDWGKWAVTCFRPARPIQQDSMSKITKWMDGKPVVIADRLVFVSNSGCQEIEIGRAEKSVKSVKLLWLIL